jgi:hypothetical protein
MFVVGKGFQDLPFALGLASQKGVITVEFNLPSTKISTFDVAMTGGPHCKCN